MKELEQGQPHIGSPGLIQHRTEPRGTRRLRSNRSVVWTRLLQLLYVQMLRNFRSSSRHALCCLIATGNRLPTQGQRAMPQRVRLLRAGRWAQARKPQQPFRMLN